MQGQFSIGSQFLTGDLSQIKIKKMCDNKNIFLNVIPQFVNLYVLYARVILINYSLQITLAEDSCYDFDDFSYYYYYFYYYYYYDYYYYY
jgi:hypothetical protein